MSVRVSVVIPAYKRPVWLTKCVSSLANQTLASSEFAVFVVDSSPDDQNEKAMYELQSKVSFALTYIRKKPEGPGPSRNMGARQNDSPFIAFLDSDCYTSPEWLEAGLNAFSDKLGLVQGRVLPEPDVPTRVFTKYIRIEAESHFYETANIFYRREAFEQSGGFPADLRPTDDRPVGGEDTEAAWNAKRLGWATAFAPQALVYHEVAPIGVKEWLWNKPLARVPGLVGSFPELRNFMHAYYFYDRAQSYLVLGIVGVALAPFTYWALLLVLPYILHRAIGPSGTLTGALRIFRVFAYFLRDFASLIQLLRGSVRYRTLLL